MNAAREPRPDPKPSPLLTAALDYAARGVPVFPLHSIQPDGRCSCEDAACVKNAGKHPRTAHGFKDATTDAGQIAKWWRRWPRANIGVPTGRASGWFVVDIDERNGGSYDQLAAQGPLPATRTAQTGSGGTHLVFAYPDGYSGGKVEQGNNKLGAGLDVKADGGYIVVAPSRHKSGGQYEWTLETNPAPVPGWILKKLGERLRPTPEPMATRRPIPQPKDATDRDAHWLAWALALARPGTSDETGFKLAQQLLLDAGVRDVDAVLREYAAQATFDTSDPFTDRDISRWLSSAASSGLVARGEPARNPNPSPAKPNAAKKHKTTAVTQATSAAAAPLHARDERPKLRALPRPDSEDEPERGGGDSGEPPTDEMLLKGEADDNGNAEAMYRLFGKEYLFTPAYGWLHWTGTHWQDEPEAVVQRKAIVTLKRRRHAAVDADAEAIIKATKADKSRVQGCLTLFKSYVIEPSVAVFDAEPDMLNCRNGAVNLRTGVITPHSPKQRFTYCVSVDYDPNADMSAWQAFILSALDGDADVARYFQLCAGYSFTGDTREEKMFYLYGPPRAGKGTVTETLLALLPHPLGTEADFASFTAKRDNDSQNFDLAELKPSRIVIASESNRYQSLNPAKIKSLTGGNMIRCAFKHKDMFSYKPQFKVWLVSNHKVTADADDEALWGRVQVFEFPHSHLGSEDVTLKARMRAPTNLQAVLRWAIEGAMAWHRLDHLTPPDAIVAATHAHRAAQDYLAQWIADACTLDARRWAASTSLRESYKNWCETMGIKPTNPNDFADALTKRFACSAKRQAGTGNRGFLGIGLGVTPPNDD